MCLCSLLLGKEGGYNASGGIPSNSPQLQRTWCRTASMYGRLKNYLYNDAWASGGRWVTNWFISFHATVRYCLILRSADSLDVYQNAVDLADIWLLWASTTSKFANVVLLWSMKGHALEQLARLVLLVVDWIFQNLCPGIWWVWKVRIEANVSIAVDLKLEQLRYAKILTNRWRSFTRLYRLRCFWNIGGLRRPRLFTELYPLPVSRSLGTRQSCITYQCLFWWAWYFYNRTLRRNFWS